MMLLNYGTKKELKTCVGQKLSYEETSMFGPEYKDDGVFCGAHRPAIQGYGREFFAEITMKSGLIINVKSLRTLN